MSIATVALNNMFWRFMERIGAQGVKLIVEIILARILLPEDYGIVALITVFINILNVFVDSGLANSLIQKKNADIIDFSTVFWFNILWCVILYILLYLIAPYFGKIFNNSLLVIVLRVLGIQLIISGIKNVQQAYVSRTMQFRLFFYSTLSGTVFGAIVGIWMAYHEFGVWSLVVQQLLNLASGTVILWVVVKWRPKAIFSFYRFKALFNYGWKLLASSLIDKIYNDIRQLIIGIYYTSTDLALFNRGNQFPYLFVSNINKSIDSVIFPTLSKEQENIERVKSITRRSIRISTYILAPIMIGLAFIGKPLIELILTEKWLPAVPYMRIFCVSYIFYPIHTANLNAIKALGRSDLFLKLEIIKKFFGILALIITIKISVLAMAYSLLFTTFTSQLINSWPNKKLLRYSYMDQIIDILPSIILSLLMGLCLTLITLVRTPPLITVLFQIMTGLLFYIGISRFLKFEDYYYAKKLLLSYLR